MTNDTLHAVAITTRTGSLYCVAYNQATVRQALLTLGGWAANKDLDFSWYDAARGMAEIRTNKMVQVIG